MNRETRAHLMERAWPAFVAALTVVSLAPLCGAPFWPVADRARLLLNASYQGFGLSQLSWIFGSFHPGNLYEPLSWLSYAADHALWGSNPAGFHLQSLALHAANAVLLYLIGERLLKDRFWAAAAALFFSLHPMRVEAVGWLSARPYLLGAFFSLVCVLFYLRDQDEPGRRRPWLVASLAAFGLALASQPFVAGLPAVLLLLDWRLGRLEGRLDDAVWRKTGAAWAMLYVLAAVGAAARDLAEPPPVLPVLSLGARLARVVCAPGEALARTFWPWRLSPILPLPAVEPARVLAAGLLLVAATALVVRRKRRGQTAAWLAFLALLAPFAAADPDGLSRQALRFGDRWTYLPSAALALGLAAALREAVAKSRLSRATGRASAYAWALFPLALGSAAFKASLAWRAPEAILQRNLRAEPDCYECASALADSARARGQTAEADRLSGLAAVWLRDAEKQRLNSRLQAVARLGDWQGLYNSGREAADHGRPDDALAFLLASLSINPRNADAQFETGYVYALKGDLDNAVERTETAIAIDPGYIDAYNNLGFFLERKGRYREAVAQFQEALKRAPGNQAALNNLNAARIKLALSSGDGWRALFNRGVAAANRGALDEASVYLLASLSIKPDNASAHDEAGYVYSLKGDLGRALEQAQAAVALDPNMSNARNNLGFILKKEGRYREAVEQFREVLKRAPGNQLARNNLAAPLAFLDLMARKDWQGLYRAGYDAIARGALDEGVALMLASIEANPRNANAHYQAGFAYGLKGDYDRAIAQTQAAVDLDPNMVDARNNLGYFLQRKGRYLEAVAQYQETLRLSPNHPLARNNLQAALSMLVTEKK